MSSFHTSVLSNTKSASQQGVVDAYGTNNTRVQDPTSNTRGLSPTLVYDKHDSPENVQEFNVQEFNIYNSWAMATMAEIRRMRAESSPEMGGRRAGAGAPPFGHLGQGETGISSTHSSHIPQLHLKPPSTFDAVVQTDLRTSPTRLERMAKTFKRNMIPKLQIKLKNQHLRLRQQSQALEQSHEYIAQLLYRFREAQDDRIESDVSHAFLEEEAENLRSSLSQKTNEAQCLASQVEQLKAEAELTRAETENLRSRLSLEASSREEGERNTQEVQRKLVAAEAQVNSLQARLEAQTNQDGASRHAANDRINKLALEVKELSGDRKRLEEAMRSARIQIQQFQDDVRISRRASERMKDEVLAEKRRYATAKLDIDSLEVRIRQMEQDAQDMATAHFVLKGERMELQNRVEALVRRLEEEQLARSEALNSVEALGQEIKGAKESRDGWAQRAEKLGEELDEARCLSRVQNEELAKLRKVERMEQATQTSDPLPVTPVMPGSQRSVYSLPPTPLFPPTPTLPASPLAVSPNPAAHPLPLFSSPVHSPLVVRSLPPQTLPERSPAPHASQPGTHYESFIDADDGTMTTLETKIRPPTVNAIVEVVESKDTVYIITSKPSRRVSRNGYQKVLLDVSPFRIEVCVTGPPTQVSAFHSMTNLVPSSQSSPLPESEHEKGNESDISDSVLFSLPVPHSMPKGSSWDLSEDSDDQDSFPISFRTRSQRQLKRRHEKMAIDSESNVSPEDSEPSSTTSPSLMQQHVHKRRRKCTVLSDDDGNGCFLSSSAVSTPVPASYWPTCQRAYVSVPSLEPS